jgi:hypothetical protein
MGLAGVNFISSGILGFLLYFVTQYRLASDDILKAMKVHASNQAVYEIMLMAFVQAFRILVRALLHCRKNGIFTGSRRHDRARCH